MRDQALSIPGLNARGFPRNLMINVVATIVLFAAFLFFVLSIVFASNIKRNSTISTVLSVLGCSFLIG